MHQRKGSKKGTGVSFCHICHKSFLYKPLPFDMSELVDDPETKKKIQARQKRDGQFYCVELLTPGDRYPVRVHKKCVSQALEDGYKKPEAVT